MSVARLNRRLASRTVFGADFGTREMSEGSRRMSKSRTLSSIYNNPTEPSWTIPASMLVVVGSFDRFEGLSVSRMASVDA